MFPGVSPLGKNSRGFDDDVRSHTGPVDFAGILYLEHFECLAVDGDCVVRVRDGLRQVAEDGVVLEQMREGLGVRNIVYRDELDVLVIERGAHDVPTDTAKAVDAYLDGHTSSVGW